MRVDFDDGVALITIDRPRSLNAIGLATMDELEAALDQALRLDPGIVVLTGAGERAFVAGGDLRELETVRTVEQARTLSVRMRGTLDRLASLPVPVMAALNGDAYGGGAEIAMACDFRLAADNARIGFTQVRLAIMPAWGGMERLAAVVGRARAMYLLASGRVLTAGEAMAWGLVEEVLPRSRFEARWRELATQIALAPRGVVTGMKAAVTSIETAPSSAGAEAATRAFSEAWAAPEHWRAADEMAQARRRAREENSGQG